MGTGNMKRNEPQSLPSKTSVLTAACVETVNTQRVFSLKALVGSERNKMCMPQMMFVSEPRDLLFECRSNPHSLTSENGLMHALRAGSKNLW